MENETMETPSMQGAWKVLLLLAPCVVFMGWLTTRLVFGALAASGASGLQAWLSATVVAGLTLFFLWLFIGFARPWLRYLRQTLRESLPQQQ